MTESNPSNYSKVNNCSVDHIVFGGSKTPMSSKIITQPFKKKFNDLTPSALKLH